MILSSTYVPDRTVYRIILEYINTCNSDLIDNQVKITRNQLIVLSDEVSHFVLRGQCREAFGIEFCPYNYRTGIIRPFIWDYDIIWFEYQGQQIHARAFYFAKSADKVQCRLMMDS